MVVLTFVFEQRMVVSESLIPKEPSPVSLEVLPSLLGKQTHEAKESLKLHMWCVCGVCACVCTCVVFFGWRDESMAARLLCKMEGLNGTLGPHLKSWVQLMSVTPEETGRPKASSSWSQNSRQQGSGFSKILRHTHGCPHTHV